MSTLTTADIASRRKGYNFIRFITPVSAAGATFTAQRYPVVGDTVTVNKINGNGVIQFRLGNKPNPWINVFEGMVLYREFDAIWIRDVHRYVAYDPTTEVEAYSSFGPLIMRGNKNPGAKGPPQGLNNLSATTTTRALSSYINEQTPGAFEGGYIIIQNTDAANSLYFGQWRDGDNAVGAGFGTVLTPGALIAFDVSSKLGPYTCPVASQDLIVDLCFWTHAGTCTFSLTLSSVRRDTGDVLYGTRANTGTFFSTLED